MLFKTLTRMILLNFNTVITCNPNSLLHIFKLNILNCDQLKAKVEHIELLSIVTAIIIPISNNTESIKTTRNLDQFLFLLYELSILVSARVFKKLEKDEDKEWD